MIRTCALPLILLTTGPALAQSPEAACPSLDFVIVYTDQITPSGTMAGFEKAAADQAKWYSDHGYKDRIFTAPVISFDEASHAVARSPNQVLVFHMHVHPLEKGSTDAAWDAFVAEYRANSTITNQTTVCYPD